VDDEVAGIFERDGVLKLQEVGRTIFIADLLKTPVTAMMPTGGKPVAMLNEWPVQRYARRGFAGTMDGTDKATFEHTNRDSFEAYPMWMLSEGWMVSKLAELVQTAGVKNERAKQAADDAALFAMQIEQQWLSDMETQKEAGADTPYQSRGMFKWLQNAAQTVRPVPEAYRLPAACEYTGAVGSYVPASMQAQLNAASAQIRGQVNLLFIAGLNLKAQMSTWPQKVTGLETSEAVTVSYNAELKDKKWMQLCDVFEFDAGKVTAMLSHNLLTDATTGANSAYTLNSGLGVDLKMWEACWYEKPTAYVEPQKSGGPRGYHSAVFILKCLNTMGQIVNRSAT
jgi:hypothetical protein